jgi:hypothetical protein
MDTERVVRVEARSRITHSQQETNVSSDQVIGYLAQPTKNPGRDSQVEKLLARTLLPGRSFVVNTGVPSFHAISNLAD